MTANQFPTNEATEILNREAANYGDEATYEFVRIVEMLDDKTAILAFRQIVNEKIVKTVCLEFIVTKEGFVKAN
jgi:hypothetical protein